MNRSIMRAHGLSLKSTKPYFNNGFPTVKVSDVETALNTYIDTTIATAAATNLDSTAVQRVATISLATVHTAGGVAAWQNPETFAIIARAFLDITTGSSVASSTIDVGAAADGTTLGDNIAAAVDATAIAFTQGNWVKIAANGGAADWITASRGAGGAGTTLTALVGKLHIIYFKAE